MFYLFYLFKILKCLFQRSFLNPPHFRFSPKLRLSLSPLICFSLSISLSSLIHHSVFTCLCLTYKDNDYAWSVSLNKLFWTNRAHNNINVGSNVKCTLKCSLGDYCLQKGWLLTANVIIFVLRQGKDYIIWLQKLQPPKCSSPILKGNEKNPHNETDYIAHFIACIETCGGPFPYDLNFPH
jgi:hypothetical protein